MSFSSFPFLLGFLPFALLGFYVLPAIRLQLAFLLGASILFYCQWSAPYSLLMLFTVCFDFGIAALLDRAVDPRRRRALLVLSLTTNLLILGFFKYYGFFSSTLNEVAGWFSVGGLLPRLAIVLPIGISFYTFQSMSYVIDVYRGTAKAHRQWLPFASYVTLFPHQIAGPIVRHDAIVPQLENPATYTFHPASFWRGWCFFLIGLGKKILIADRLGAIVSPLVAGMGQATQLEAIVAMLSYTMQLYFDFSGYSDMAVGLGLMLNIRFPQNFNSPYKSRSITEFWRRWHITLSHWLRSYVYISLGGNRRGEGRTYVNLLVTMLVGGLWHGANWTFVAWGFLHGVALCLEKRFVPYREHVSRAGAAIGWAATFLFVNIAWVFFRSPDFATAFLWLKKMALTSGSAFWRIPSIPPAHQTRSLAVLIIAGGIAFRGKNTFRMEMKPSVANALLLAALFGLSLMYMQEESPFLYFQF